MDLFKLWIIFCMSTEFNFENWVKSNLTKNAIRVLNDVNLFAKWMIDNYECKMNRKGIIYIQWKFKYKQRYCKCCSIWSNWLCECAKIMSVFELYFTNKRPRGHIAQMSNNNHNWTEKLKPVLSVSNIKYLYNLVENIFFKLSI